MKLLFEQIGATVTDAQIGLFSRYMELVLEWNEKFNLTAIVNEKDIVLKHFIDSLSIVKYVEVADNPDIGPVTSKPDKKPMVTEIGAIETTADTLTKRILAAGNAPGKSVARRGHDAIKFVDVGAGAGFPGIPVKIVLGNDIDATLIESVGKKVRFMDEAIETLCLKDIKTEHIRAEEAGHMAEFRGLADVVAVRAVASLPVLLELCSPLLQPGGTIIVMKSGNETVDEEIRQSQRALKILCCTIEKTDRFYLPGSDIRRAIIIVRKVRKTPAEYPRRSGIPSKSPLI